MICGSAGQLEFAEVGEIGNKSFRICSFTFLKLKEWSKKL